MHWCFVEDFLCEHMGKISLFLTADLYQNKAGYRDIIQATYPEIKSRYSVLFIPAVTGLCQTACGGPGVFHMAICVMCIRFCIPFFKVFKHHWHYHKPSLEETFHHTSAAVMFTIKCYLHDGKGRLGWNQAEKVLTLLFIHPHSTTSNFNTLLLSWCNYKSYWTNYGIC